MGQPTLFVDMEKLKDHCTKQFEEYGECLQKHPQHSERMCAVSSRQLQVCAEQ